MEIGTYSLSKSTKGNCDIVDITDDISLLINKNKFDEGHALIFVGGSTVGITTIEYEPGLRKDYPKLFSRIAPENINYDHDNTWHDGNGPRQSFNPGCIFNSSFFQRKIITWHLAADNFS